MKGFFIRLVAFAKITVMVVACGNDNSASTDKVSENSEQEYALQLQTSSYTSQIERLAEEFKDCSVYYDAGEKTLNPNLNYGELLDSRDGQVYKTIKIGTQTWMAENLNYAYLSHAPLPYDSVKKLQCLTTLDSSSFCYCNNSEACKKYGRLYLWSAAMDSASLFSGNGKGCGIGGECPYSTNLNRIRGICPNGWHLPSKDEWRTMYSLTKYEEYEYYKQYNYYEIPLLITSTGWINIGGNNSYGFSALPSGRGFHNSENCDAWSDNVAREHVSFAEAGIAASFWSYGSKKSSSTSSYAYTETTKTSPVIIYFKPECGSSDDCLGLMDERNILWDDISIEETIGGLNSPLNHNTELAAVRCVMD